MMERREDPLVDAEIGMPHVRAFGGAIEGEGNAPEALRAHGSSCHSANFAMTQWTSLRRNSTEIFWRHRFAHKCARKRARSAGSRPAFRYGMLMNKTRSAGFVKHSELKAEEIEVIMKELREAGRA